MAFVPNKVDEVVEKVPYFEDITAKDVAGRGVTKSQDHYIKKITDCLTRLGAYDILFTAGKYDVAALKTLHRFGFQVTFHYHNQRGRLDVAALPLRTPEHYSIFESKKDRALAMALYWQGNQLQTEIDSKMFLPGSSPLVSHLIGKGDKTVTEIVVGGLMDKLPRFVSDRPQITSKNVSHDVIDVQPEEV